MDMTTAYTAQRLGALIEPIHEEARAFARRVARSNADGDDLFHEALLRAMAKLHTLNDEDRFRFWFLRLLIRVHRSQARRGFWRRLLSLDDPQSAIDAGAIGWEEASVAAQRARTLLATLPAVQREALVLYEMQGHSVQEIAQLQQASLSAVKTRGCAARRAGRATRPAAPAPAAC